MNGFDLPTLSTLVATLGWTLLHFLWQGAVVGVLFGLALALTARASAPTRYRVALAFFVLLAACPVVTFIWLSPEQASVTGIAMLGAPAATAMLTAAANTAGDWRAFIDPWLPWAVLVWAAGVTFMTGRLLVEWREVRRLTRVDIEPLSRAWQLRVSRLCATLGVERAVAVLQSARVHVPLVVGWLKPVILVPMGALAGLTPAQLELILMHELAHVRRNDYLVNLLQVVVETLLFYHPVVRWVSRVLREERENCCDDLVVARSGDALGYARALTELAGAQSLALQTSVGSDGGKLLSRIKRIVAVREPTRVAAHWSVGALLAVFGLSLSGLLHPMGAPVTREEAAPPAAVSTAVEPAVQAAPVRVAAVEVPVMHTPAMRPSASQAPAKRTVTRPAADSAAAAPSTSAETAAAPAMPAIEQPEAGATPDLTQPTQAPTEAVASMASAAPEAVTRAVAEAPQVPEPQADSSAQGDGPSIGAAPASPLPAARAIWLEQPEFPVAARLSGIEGWVTVNYTIDEKGRVSTVQIIDAKPRKVFDSAVRKAVRNWRFEPMIIDGQAAPRRMTQTIQFSLDYKMICNAGASTGTRLADRCRTKDEIERQSGAQSSN